jgi:hypothetical protein
MVNTLVDGQAAKRTNRQEYVRNIHAKEDRIAD